MRAISALIFEYGMSTSSFCARVPLRIRAKKSAMGSVTVLIKKSGGLCGRLPCPVAKRHSHFAQKRFGFLVRARRSHNCNVKSDVALDFIELDLRKNRLIRNSERIIAVIVKTTRGHATKVPNPGEGGLDKALEEFIHTLSA